MLIRARTDELLSIRLDGASTTQIIQYVREKEKSGEFPWKVGDDGKPVSERMIYRLLNRGDLVLEKHFEANRAKLMRKAIAQRDNVVARALAAGDNATALRAMDSRDRRYGLFPDLAVPIAGDVPRKEMQAIIAQPEAAALMLQLAEKLVGGDQPKQVEAIVVPTEAQPAEAASMPSAPPPEPPPAPPSPPAPAPAPRPAARQPVFNVFDIEAAQAEHQDAMQRKMNRTYGA
jgi:hypothetical protein